MTRLLRRQFLAAAALTALPAPAIPDGAAGVRASLATARALFDAGRHHQLLAGLPRLLARAHAAADQHPGAGAHRDLAAVYHIATAAHGKLGDLDAASTTAARAAVHAESSGSPLLMASSAHALSTVLRQRGRHADAARLTLTAVDRIEAIGPSDPAYEASRAQLLCTAAYSHAHLGDAARAADLITEAARAAARLPEEGLGGHTTYPPFTVSAAQVQLYAIGVHWALGDSATALDVGRGLSPGQMPTPERRARLSVDLARAWWQHGRPEPALAALLTAHRDAPDEVTRPSIRRLGAEIPRRHPRAAGARELRAILEHHQGGPAHAR